ncbi:MAG: AMP-binding enzyme, partial [Desulfosudaceae bacterium]
YPAEIEDCLLGHPAVADVGVIGTADEKWGEAVKAIVVLAEGQELAAEELIAWAAERIARFKVPRQIEFTDAIPRTPTGKILKRVLRDQFGA